MKTKWICKGCSSGCIVETEEDLAEHSKCVRWELSISKWEKSKSMNEMMEELMNLYPGNQWNFIYSMEKDAGGEYVPGCFARFGKLYYGEDSSDDTFVILYLDDNGQAVDSEDFVTYYECADGGLETSPEQAVKMIYDEVMRRRHK